MPAPPKSPIPDAAGGRRLAGHTALVFVQIFFALFPVFGKVLFQDGVFSPFSIAVWRIGFGASSLLAIAFALHGRRALPRARDLPMLLVLSILGVTANMTLYLEGLSRSTATNAGLMMCLIPVFTFVIAAAVKQEVFQAVRALGVLVALAGAGLLVWSGEPELGSEHGLGNLLMAMNTLGYAFYLVLSRPLLARYPAIVVIAWVFVLAVPFAPFLARGTELVPEASPGVWWALAFVLVFPTSLAYLLNAFALARVRASTTAMYIYAQPLITGVVSRIWLGEKLSRGTILSSVFIFLGIWLVSRKRPAAASAPAEA
ncbi:MAG: DMT family transporter [Planctomycetota bacterium]